MNAMRLPTEWRAVQLKDVCEKTTLTNPTTSPDKPFVYVDVSSVSNESYQITETKELLGSDAPSRARKLIRTDDIIFATVRPTLKRVAMVPAELDGEVCSTGYCVVRPNKVLLEPAFVYFYLLTEDVTARVKSRQKGAMYPAIRDSDLLNEAIFLPPLPEQRSIAHSLRTVQEAREARQRELELEHERKAALLQHLFAYGTQDELRRQTEIGEVPESWQVVTFAKAVAIAEGQVNPKEEPYKSMIHVGSENIESGTGRLEATRTNGELTIISGNYYFTPQDVLYSKIRPYLNKVALPACEGTCSADMYPLKPREGQLIRDFLFHYLLSEQFLRRAMSFQNRTGIPKINRNQLNSIPLARPSLSEQQQIAAILSACDTKVAALEQEITLLDELLRAMLEELMMGRLSITALLEEATV